LLVAQKDEELSKANTRISELEQAAIDFITARRRKLDFRYRRNAQNCEYELDGDTCVWRNEQGLELTNEEEGMCDSCRMWDEFNAGHKAAQQTCDSALRKLERIVKGLR